MKVVVASINPVKVKAVTNAFRKVFPKSEIKIESTSVESGVSEQPMSNNETLKGAMGRAENAQTKTPKADFWVGIEGGLEWANNQLSSFTWVVVMSQTQVGKARSDTFFLPQKVADLIKKGKELGEANNVVFKQNNTKQTNGAAGLLTRNLVTRDKLYEDTVIFALIPFINKGLY